MFALRPIEIVPPVIINNTDAFFIKITVFERCRDYVFREAKLQKNVELQTDSLSACLTYPSIAARAYGLFGSISIPFYRGGQYPPRTEARQIGSNGFARYNPYSKLL